MANYSSAFGTYTFVGNWTKKMCSKWNTIAKWFQTFTYDTYFDESLTPGYSKYLDFDANGRWAYDSFIEHFSNLWEFVPEGEKEKKERDKAYRAYRDLCKLMDENFGTMIVVNFVDREGGNSVLYEATGIIRLVRIEEPITKRSRVPRYFLKLEGEIIDQRHYEYNNENLTRLGFPEEPELEKEDGATEE